ncbi:MAG: ABC transporter permease [Pseudomonadota bacterium]|nr:ABC transporter permease [Pseudomonadota bacterium]
MGFPESIRVACRALRQNPLRSSLAMLGIVIGVAVVVTILAIAGGSHALLSAQLRSLGTNLLYVLPRADDSSGTPLKSAGRHPLTEDDATAIVTDIPDVVIAAPMVSSSGQIVRGNRNWFSTVVGTTPGFLEAREWRFADGRPMTQEEVDSADKVVVIGATVAEKLFGSDPGLDQIVRVEGVPLRVIGVLRKKGQTEIGWDQDNVIYVPMTTAKLRISGGMSEAKRQAVGLILVRVSEQDAIDAVAEDIRSLMRLRHRLPQGSRDDFSVRNMESVIEKRDETARILTLQLSALASIALLVGGIAIMNIMIVSVTERTREIGIRLAVGARQRDIRNQFLVEAMILCLFGGLAGTVLGACLAYVFSWVGGWPVMISPVSIIMAFCSAGLVGVVFGFYPAYRASRMEPIDALRHE